MNINENQIAGIISTTRVKSPEQTNVSGSDDVYYEVEVPYYYPSIGSFVNWGLYWIGLLEMILFLSIVIVGGVGFIIYFRKNKTYKCPSCGKEFKHKGLKPKVCLSCGAELNPPKCP